MSKIQWKEVYPKTKEFIHLSFKKYLLFLVHLTPHQNVAQTILMYMILGWFLLSLPFMTQVDVPILDNLFTAAAAVSPAGLATVNFADSYTLLGKIVVLFLIQIGGVGYMTFTSFLFISLSQRQLDRKRTAPDHGRQEDRRATGRPCLSSERRCRRVRSLPAHPGKHGNLRIH